jgi:hypothetical protein
VVDRLDSAVATRAQDWDHVYPAVRRMAGMQAWQPAEKLSFWR